MSKIFLDPGHGGSDPGAVRNGLQEKVLTLDIAKRVEKLLKNYAGVQIKLSRTTDKYLTLAQRANMANNWGADLFVSIHINAGGGTGYEDFIYNQLSNSSTTAKRRGSFHTNVVKEQSFWKNRGKKKANFAVLRLTNMSGILTENGFIDTKSDADKLKLDKYLERIAKSHVDGIVEALGLKKKTSNSTKTSSKPSSKPKATSTPKNNNSTYTGNSLVDYLKSVGINSGFANRKKLAEKHGIKGYRGTATENLTLLNKLRSGSTSKASKPKGDMKTNSIVDYLKSIKIDSSYNNRKKLAAKYGIKNYTGTASQNATLLKKMRGK